VGASGAVFGLFGAVLALALWGGRRYRENRPRPISGSSIRPKIHSVYMFSSRCAGLDIECENPVLLGLAPGYVSQAPWTVITSGFSHSMSNPAHLLPRRPPR
jgi:membrane associated rhomboid family serine protease